ncbi:hypothetical protein [Saccharopolyspora elongata]|uniref:Aminoglycoside phosphotransferase domain-containing protein n=1 Tax=Saccharopolyspora elongata TaxID=2530387 RepID=A0A4R4Z818_9PSEU|nr:hypothetical protein [Saccharopolyspora elongata]TDD54305.1 hypothetical protein E1288_06825 [Saccharopolyspora elongata]
MVFSVVAPTVKHLSLFRDDLWKEQRSLEVVVGDSGTRVLRKHFSERRQADSEVRYLSVASELAGGSTPSVVGVADNYVDLRYVEGIRVYNVLELLRELEGVDDRANRLRSLLVERCAASCAALQEVLVRDAGRGYAAPKLYPVRQKLTTLLAIIDHGLGLGLDMVAIETEARWAEDCLRQVSCLVPFRDAAPKNLILEWPEMWRGRKSVEEQRRSVQDLVANWSPGAGSPFESNPIVHVDFSSCGELTVPEDDPISLLVHESTWMGEIPGRDRLCWLPHDPDATRLAVGLLVRLYRLGGRRLCYLLVHKTGYRRRYAHESVEFYFRALLLAADTACPELKSLFPAILGAAEAILSRLSGKLSIAHDWFDAAYEPPPGKYYRDVFPY